MLYSGAKGTMAPNTGCTGRGSWSGYAMKRSRAQVQAVALLGGLCFCTALHAQEAAPAVSPPAVTPEDEIVVHGKALENLRVRIERAEDDVYTRFNEINSDDSL